MTTHEHVLEGCRPVPLASYLKALGILRLVAEQADPEVRGAWQRDRFVLHTKLDREAVETFFLEKYAPSPIVAPWNGGSGFFPSDNRTALEEILSSASDRLAPYRETIQAAQLVLTTLGIDEKASGEQKAELLEACRGRLPEGALAWLDAAFVLSQDGPKYPPLLGTGGNDGRLDFTNNFMQRVVELLAVDSGSEGGSQRGLLRNALFETSTDALTKRAVGQFLPGRAGGANAQSGFDGQAAINPWDFVLMLEGALIFASTGAKRLASQGAGVPSYPFAVRQVGAGYGSAALADAKSSRAEMWLPLWESPAGASEVRTLLGEGRARVAGRTPANGLDFARAVTSLGVDRGISAFQRYGFQERNGLAYFAVPLQRVEVRREPAVLLLHEIDGWLDSFRRRVAGDHTPASVSRAARRVEAAVFALSERGDPARRQEVLIALGACERAMATSWQWTRDKSYTTPVPLLSGEWLQAADDGTPELRLAASLASVHGKYGKETWTLRRHLEPVTMGRPGGRPAARWVEQVGRDVVGTSAPIVDTLNACLARRIVRAVQVGADRFPDGGYLRADLGDVADFIEGRIDDERLVDLLWACSLLDWPRIDSAQLLRRRRPAGTPSPGALYALMKLCFADKSPVEGADPVVITPLIHRLAAQGRGAEASRQAIRRLRASGYAPALSALYLKGEAATRAAAALLFPLPATSLRSLMRLVCSDVSSDESNDEASSSNTTTTTRTGATA